MHPVLSTAAIAAIATATSAQSLNIDLAASGELLPSDFGAQGSAGIWNIYPEEPGASHALTNLAGNATGASLTVTGFVNVQHIRVSTIDADVNGLANTRLISHGSPIVMTFTGLQNATYEVWTYVISTGSSLTPEVTLNSDASTTQFLTQGWSGSLVLGQTHAYHTVEVIDGTLSVAVAASNDPWANGIQLVIPAPSTLALAPLACLLAPRRRRT